MREPDRTQPKTPTMPAKDEVIVLASASPRRRAMMEYFGVPFEVIPSELSEFFAEGEGQWRALDLARKKAFMLSRKVKGRFILAADTMVHVGKHYLGKPKDRDDALRMIKMLSGRDMVTNLPQTTEITSTQIYEALHEPCLAILGAIKWVLERTPPELAADIMHNGLYLTGGGSLLYGMDQLIASELGIPVLLSKEPMDCAALGLGNIIENYELLEHLGRTSFLKPF